MKNHYFIAVVPPESICETVTSFKQELSAQFGTKQSLKSPPHITLQMPFFREESAEEKLEDVLQTFAKREKPFAVNLNGFDAFAPRVIFVKIENHAPFIDLHHRLKQILAKELNFAEKELTHKIHPHMTIAHRDLKEKDFPTAWEIFKARMFKADFEAKCISLLKHNGKSWDVYREFNF